MPCARPREAGWNDDRGHLGGHHAGVHRAERPRALVPAGARACLELKALSGGQGAVRAAGQLDADLLAGQFLEKGRRGTGTAGEQRGDRGRRRRGADPGPGGGASWSTVWVMAPSFAALPRSGCTRISRISLISPHSRSLRAGRVAGSRSQASDSFISRT